jgi:hypothetical protein
MNIRNIKACMKKSKPIIKRKSKGIKKSPKVFNHRTLQYEDKDVPLYHAIQIGAGYNIHSKQHTTMNLYISDEMLKASERERLRRLSKAEKIKEEVIIIRPPKKDNE